MHEANGFLFPLVGRMAPWLYGDSWVWTLIGLAGAGLFSSRFVIQWLHSERKKQLVVPPIFWQLSFWGSALQLVYALHIDKLPIILSYAFLPFLYARNLWLLKRTPGENESPLHHPSE
ncbi:lipid-A-disaccharide synthase N-terminal domain-containing protein [Dyella sp. C9]|uniref:lipid-A-disaccharide synthase N-terminal domain-containing protein n=1 Tax=Dyella sp. C9 TaxID=2202154 RepID=UPI000DEF0E8D